ncbi:MAG: sigma-54 dependent transcriptional regulator [Bacteroidota bacterium]
MSRKLPGRILIVDDDSDILLTARMVLKRQVSQIETENDPHQLTRLLNEQVYDLVLLDMNFTAGFTSGKEGLRWLKKIRKVSPATHVILMTAYGDINLAVKAMKEGASDFVVKPWENEALQESVRNAITSPFPGVAPPATEAQSSSKGGSIEAPTIIGESGEMQQVAKVIRKVAATEANVLILGENGTGKELAARSIHLQSPRANQPFVHVDLGAIPESLFESELFGHVKGAFTDARDNRSGRFEAAQGGTLFLDEIGNLSLPLQAKLLSALQNRSIHRVGSNQAIPIDIRLVCATNMPLYQMVGEKGFRQDLIYRINTVEITLPPLRQRKADIPKLVRHFLQIYRDKYQRPNFKLKPESLRLLQQYSWPGNIRELRHAMERAVIMEDPGSLIPKDLGIDLPTQHARQEEFNLEEVEKTAIIKAISKHQGNISRAAKELGLGRTTLYRKMNKYGL